jgi:presenilin-like A22 family membrane protease
LSGAVDREVKVTARAFLPVGLSLALSWLLTLLSRGAEISYPTPIITPIEEPEPTTPPTKALSTPAPYLNMLIVLGLITASSLVMLYLARKRKNVFRILTGILIWLISFGVTVIYLINIAMALNWMLLRFWLPAGALTASLITYLMLRGGGLIISIPAAYIASGAGATIGMSIPYWTFIVLLLGISAYDAFAVYRGHLSTLSKEEAISLKGLTVEVDDIVIGLGDLFFYSLAVSAIFRYMGVAPAIAATISILVGYSITLLLLRRRHMLPGLPIPLLLAMGSALVVNLILNIPLISSQP